MSDIENKVGKKLNIWLPLLFALVMTGGMLLGSKLKQPNSPKIVIQSSDSETEIDYTKIGQGRIEDLIRYVEARYVDDVNSEELIKKAIDNIIGELDPHSSYIPSSEVKRVNEELKGNFDGVGIEFMILDDTILIVSAMKDGPSAKAGIQSGDKIVEIGDSIAVGDGIDPTKLVNKLRGKKGTEVKIGVLRGNDKEIKSFNVVRDEIPMYSVDVSYMLDEKTGYIKVNRFSATTTTEFMERLKILVEKKGLKDLVIDLRQNPGGYLNEATKILSQLFKEKGKLLVYTEGRTVSRNEYETTGQTFFDIGKVAVLIDENSASASEIMAGAIQDWDRGIIVGRRTYGKGLVQEQYELKDGSALRLTVARYFTPTNRSIQRSYKDKDKKIYDDEGNSRMLKGELLHRDSIVISDTAQYFTLNENRVVYGGGGITPDIFVPIDTTLWNDQYVKFRQVLPQFVFRYIEKNKENFDGMRLEEFRKDFVINDFLLEEFFQYANEKGISNKSKVNGSARKNLQNLIKARIARSLYDEEGFFTIWNDYDEMIKSTLRAFKSENPLTYSR